MCSRTIGVILLSDIVAEKPNQRDSDLASLHQLRTTHELLDDGELEAFGGRADGISTDSIATIMSTSGTTGLPKMVGRTHRALVQETAAIEDNYQQKSYPIRRLYCTPMFHAYSFPEMVVNTLRLGHPSYYMSRFDDTFATKVQKFGLTETMAAPAMIMYLADQAKDEAGRTALQSLRQVLCAGAPLTEALRSRFLAVFDEPVRLVQVWGMSEGGWFTTFKFPEDDRTGSVGRAVPGYQIRMSDDIPTELADGTKATELYVKGPQLTTSYLSNEKASIEAFDTDGWMRSGDIGYIREGKVYLVDRAKNCIKVNGWSVSPTEMEAALAYSSLVVDAAVVGSNTGIEEHPVIFVVPTHTDVSAEEIKSHLLGRLAKYKVSKSEVMFVSCLPRNSSGKVLRNKLREGLS